MNFYLDTTFQNLGNPLVLTKELLKCYPMKKENTWREKKKERKKEKMNSFSSLFICAIVGISFRSNTSKRA